MKRIIDISEEDYNFLIEHKDEYNYEHTRIAPILNSTPLNECEVGDLLPKYINALRKCAKEHEKDFVPTFNVRTSDLCYDTAKLLEQIHHQRNIFAFANDMEVSVKQAEKELRVECEAEDCIKNAYDAGFKDGAHDGYFSDLIDDDREDSHYGRLLPNVYPKSDKSVLESIKAELWMEGVNLTGEYQGIWIRYKDIERVIDSHISGKEQTDGEY